MLRFRRDVRTNVDRTSGAHPCASFLDGAAAVDPTLEATEIAHVDVAHVLQGLAGKRGSAARGAVQDHGLVAIECVVIIRAVGISAEFAHAAGDVLGSLNLTAALDLKAVAHIDPERLHAPSEFWRLAG